MKEKLTLTIERETKERAKRFARRKGISISSMVEKFLDAISGTEAEWKPREGSVVSEISGSIPVPPNETYDNLLTEALMEKYDYEKDTD